MKKCNSCDTVKSFESFYRRKDKYQHKCKDCEKSYKLENLDKQRESKRNHYIKNIDLIKNRSKEYKKKHGKRMRDKLFSERPEQKVLHYLRSRLNHILKSEKKNTTSSLLGCTILEFKTHIEKQFEKGMSWDNYGLYGWHIDHIIPCAMFNMFDENDLKQCFHYTNLQPLWAKDNILKSDKILVPTQTHLPI
jgi:hypothetical protein